MRGYVSKKLFLQDHRIITLISLRFCVRNNFPLSHYLMFNVMIFQAGNYPILNLQSLKDSAQPMANNAANVLAIIILLLFAKEVVLDLNNSC